MKRTLTLTGSVIVLIMMLCGNGLGETGMRFFDEKAGLWMVLGTLSKDCGEDVQSRLFFNEFEIEPRDSDILKQIKAEIKENIFHIRVDGNSSSYWIPGTIDGDRISIQFHKPVWDSEYGFNGGTISLNASGTLTDHDRTVTGTAEWTWKGDNAPPCSGTIQFKAAYLEESYE